MNEQTQLDIVLQLKDELSGKMKGVNSSLSRMGDIGSGLQGTFSRIGDRFSTEFDLIGKAVDIAKYAVIGFGSAIVAVGYSGIKMAGQLESAEAGFKTLLGSAEKARGVMDRIKKEAAATPFELPGLVKGAQALTAVTKDGDKAIDTLLDVGKAIAASGKGNEELESVIVNLQQISSTGKVTAMDIRQLQMAVPIFNDIIGASGLTVEKLQNSENAAKLLFEAFKKAGQEGGITARGFIDQAGTWNQLISNLSDSYTILSSDIVKQAGVFDLAKDAVLSLTTWIENNKQAIIDFTKNAVDSAVKSIKEWVEKMGGAEGIKQKLIEFKDKLVNDVIPAVEKIIKVVVEVTKFIWEHRDAILIAIVAWETLKVGLSIWDTIKTTRLAIQALTMAMGSGGLAGAAGTLSAVALPALVVAAAAVATVLVVKAVKAASELGKTLGELESTVAKNNSTLDEYQKKVGSLSTEKANQQLQNSIDKARELNKEAERLSKLGFFGSMKEGIKELFKADGGIVPQHLASGGVVYASNGFFEPRGTDTIPTMLTPGEMVLNAGQQSNLFNQLNGGGRKAVAINITGENHFYNDQDVDNLISKIMTALSRQQERAEFGM